MNYLVPIVGIHASGKTALLNSFSSLGFLTDSEIAEQLREKEGLCVAEKGDVSLEYRLMQLEIERDHQRPTDATPFFFVETWHVLILAHMITRGADSIIIDAYRRYLSHFCRTNNVYCFFLKLSPSLILERSTKVHSPTEDTSFFDFYDRLNHNIQCVLDDLHIRHTVIDANMQRLAVTAAAVQHISQALLQTDYPHKLRKRWPTYVRLNITTRCNHHCIHCHNEGEKREPIDIDPKLAVKLAEAFAKLGFQKLKLIGGEPVLHPSFAEILYGLSRLTFKDIALISNGTDMDDLLKAMRSAGLKRLNITIPSLHPGRYKEFTKSVHNPEEIANKVIEALKSGFGPIKVNTFYWDENSQSDLEMLVERFSRTDVTIGVLSPLVSVESKRRFLGSMKQIIGRFNVISVEQITDNDSLATTRYRLKSGPFLDFKTSIISSEKLFTDCADCSFEYQCAEGIYAIRITPTGSLRTCLLRDDNLFPLAEYAELSLDELAAILSFLLWFKITE